MKDIPKSYKTKWFLYEVMSNFDSKINKSIEKELKENKLYAWYSAWDFHWDVRWNKKWYCKIMVYHNHIETLEAKTLESIMEQACEKYGKD